MKIVSLNAWGGRCFAPLMEFLEAQAVDADVFCLQEMFKSTEGETSAESHPNIFDKIATLLSGFEAHFLPVQAGYYLDTPIAGVMGGQALFIKKGIVVEHVAHRPLVGPLGKVFFVDGKIAYPSALQYADLRLPGGILRVAHVHGVGRPGSKLDTPARLEQSAGIAVFLSEGRLPTVLCGDFNLMPETESVAAIERVPMRNLIKEFKITDTRGDVNREKFPLGKQQSFADYVFVSPEVAVRSFIVPAVSVSDHLPLILECE